jgi:hypothetical protein
MQNTNSRNEPRLRKYSHPRNRAILFRDQCALVVATLQAAKSTGAHENIQQFQHSFKKGTEKMSRTNS